MKKLTTTNRRGKFLLPLPAESQLRLNQQICLHHGAWWTVAGIDPDNREVCLQRKILINTGSNAYPSRKGSSFSIEEYTMAESEILDTLAQAAKKAASNARTKQAAVAPVSAAPVKKSRSLEELKRQFFNRRQNAKKEREGPITSILLPDGIRV
jgi:hypothetical protein